MTELPHGVPQDYEQADSRELRRTEIDLVARMTLVYEGGIERGAVSLAARIERVIYKALAREGVTFKWTPGSAAPMAFGVDIHRMESFDGGTDR